MANQTTTSWILELVDEITAPMKGVIKSVNVAGDAINDMNQNVLQQGKSWAHVVTGINQATDLIQKSINGLSFTIDASKLRTEVQRMTDLAGEDLDNFIEKSSRIGAVYDASAHEIAKAANVMTKQGNGTFEDNLKLIEEGFKRGANSNGNMLDQLQEYPSFLKSANLSMEQTIALMANANKMGVFGDKAIDSIKEADMALREIQQPQKDALAAIGIDYNEQLAGKSTFEAIKIISEKMKSATSQA
jgi:phage-related minor tail protein